MRYGVTLTGVGFNDSEDDVNTKVVISDPETRLEIPEAMARVLHKQIGDGLAMIDKTKAAEGTKK